MRVFRGVQAVALACCLAVPALAQGHAQRQDVLSIGVLSSGSTEIYLRRVERPLSDRTLLGRLQPVYGLSVATRGEAWVGGGLAYAFPVSAGGVFLRGSVMPGLHVRGRGRDLGGPVMFRSGLELGVPLGRGVMTAGVDHRSNAGLYRRNPGVNSLFLSYSVGLR